MITRIKNILTYCDSEPLETILGFTWLVFFPIVSYINDGLHLLIQGSSIILGIAIINAVCYFSLEVRKNISFIMFIFSCIIAVNSFFHFDLSKQPSQLIWSLLAIMALINLNNITKHYYNILGNGTY